MFNFEENALVTISPNIAKPQCGATRFRWRMHCALPFVLPATKCLEVFVERDGFKFKAFFHNHLDRRTRIHEVPGSLPITELVEKLKEGQEEAIPPQGERWFRDHLQSVVEFVEQTECSSSEAAFKKADAKIRTCFAFLGEKLAAIQRSLPYFAMWTIYPVSLFDIGTVHHAVDHFCPTDQLWKLTVHGVALSLARQLRAPLFVMDLETAVELPGELDLANELLAEAQVSLFRGLYRLAVLNSFTALETFANSTFKTARNQQLIAWGVPLEEAEEIAEAERKRSRTDEKFLLHVGLKKTIGRSLAEDDKQLYDELIDLEQRVRHAVVHRGVRPEKIDAKACFGACCRAVRWLCKVIGHPVKELFPTPEFSAPGFSVASGEPHVCTAHEMELIRRMMNVVDPRYESLKGP